MNDDRVDGGEKRPPRRAVIVEDRTVGEQVVCCPDEAKADPTSKGEQGSEVDAAEPAHKPWHPRSRQEAPRPVDLPDASTAQSGCEEREWKQRDVEALERGEAAQHATADTDHPELAVERLLVGARIKREVNNGRGGREQRPGELGEHPGPLDEMVDEHSEWRRVCTVTQQRDREQRDVGERDEGRDDEAGGKGGQGAEQIERIDRVVGLAAELVG